MHLYESHGWENQKVYNDFLTELSGKVNYKYLAAAIVAYRRAREASLMPYQNVSKTLTELARIGVKIAVISDAP